MSTGRLGGDQGRYLTERAGVNAGSHPCILFIGRGATKWMVQTILIGPPPGFPGLGRKAVRIRRGRAAVTGKLLVDDGGHNEPIATVGLKTTGRPVQ